MERNTMSDGATDPGNPRPPVSSVANALGLLEILGRAGAPLTLAALVRRTGRPKSTLHRLLAALRAAGFVRQDPATGAYGLTIKLWSLGQSVFAGLDLARIAVPHLEALMSATDETSHVAVLDGIDTAVYLAMAECGQAVAVKTQIGDRLPAYGSSSGRSILAFQDDQAVADLLRRPLTKYTADTVTDPSRLAEMLAAVRRLGYAVARGETYPERGGVAAPVRDHTGAVIAACGIAAPVFRMDAGLVERCIPLVLAAAAAISDDLGYAAGAA
jgi:DNA-binding IclR family transcriptional regulator